jgi:membrane-bound lytic murein transglycosylase D
MMKHVCGIRSWLVVGCLALPAALMSGSKGKVGVKSFVPPAPATPTAVEATMIEGPEFDSRLFAKELPLVFAAKVPSGPRYLEAELRLRKAEEHLRKGKELAAKGEMPAARIEFDSAVEEISGASPILPDRARLLAKYQSLVDEIFGLESKHEVSTPEPKASEPGPGFERAPVEQIAETTFSIEPELKGKVLDQVKSTVSQLRLEVEDPVVGYINFFTTPFGREIVAAGMRRAGRFAPMIRRILDEEGLPPEMIYLAQAESGFMPRAISWAAAGGMWQFVQSRGREYGLTQTPFTDERFDPEKATRAAARHLRDLYHQFGDWYLAVAAYNCGPWAVERGVQRTGYADFWELYKRNVLPRETANYLPIILALTIMAKNPKAYGLDGITPDAPHDYDTIRLSADTHLELVADLAERPLPQIQELNPSVLKLIAPAGYEIHVPKGAGKATQARLEFVPAAKRTCWRVRRIQTGESVASVAAHYHVTEQSVAAANRPPAGGDAAEWSPEPGDFLVIPAPYAGATTAPAAARRNVALAKTKTAAAPAHKVATKATAAHKPSPKTVAAVRR